MADLSFHETAVESKRDPVALIESGTNRWSKYAAEMFRDQRPPLLSTVRVSRLAEITKEKKGEASYDDATVTEDL